MLPDLAVRYGVSMLWVFGSWAQGKQRDSSDVDILVDFDGRDFSLLDFIGLEQEIEAKLGIKVDLVDRQALRQEIRPFVLPKAVAV